jgi:hypothetical protein
MKKINWQIFISFNLLFTFLIMVLSGVVLYLKPEGSIARWLDWQILGIGKSGWESVHTVFSFLFLAFALFHILKVNLRIMRAYFVNHKPSGSKRELMLSVLISAVFMAGTVMYLPPFSLVYQAGNDLSARWKEKVQLENERVGPRQSLGEVASALDMDARELGKWMEQRGLAGRCAGAALMEVADKEKMSPYALYRQLREWAGHRNVKQTHSGTNTGEYSRDKFSAGHGNDTKAGSGTSGNPGRTSGENPGEIAGKDTTPQSNNDKEHLYRSVTLEEMALVLDVRVERIQELLSERYGIPSAGSDESLYDVAIKGKYEPGRLGEKIRKHLE